jgi:hypothetical protein
VGAVMPIKQRRRHRRGPDNGIERIDVERRQSNAATKERIAELARQVAAGEYDPKRRMREVFGMSVPSKERKR